MDNYSRNYRYDIEQTSSFNIVFASLMRKVYLWMFAGLLMTALTAMTAAKNSEFMSALLSNNLYFYGIIIGEFALVIYLSRSIMNMSFLTAGLCFALYAILNGLVMFRYLYPRKHSYNILRHLSHLWYYVYHRVRH